MKVTEYEGHKVPDGATRFHAEDEMFLKFGNFWRDGKWHALASWDNSLSPANSIELPEQPTKADEWVPSVGEECLVEYPYRDGSFQAFHGKKVTILGKCKDSDNCDVFTAHGSNGFIALNTLGFRPLKTAEEKKCDSFIEVAYEMTMSTDKGLKRIFAIMYECGFTAPKRGE